MMRSFEPTASGSRFCLRPGSSSVCKSDGHDIVRGKSVCSYLVPYLPVTTRCMLAVYLFKTYPVMSRTMVEAIETSTEVA